ncbi:MULTISPECIES: peptidoglycan-binding protein [unclassified Streptomyces]|uniref:peptidoglycan-binding domain-containing protein n=1 Tax=unclassified Streptomyces TaxID=2593676 RepID=UPI0021A70886|nr:MULTISPECIES: peptidoglycan-binding protein [unclassified Streptomyces]MCX4774996.1 peptidoglycan-binding protein [Streptomyces sp. NBC_01285]
MAPAAAAQASWPTVKSGQRGVDVTTVQLLLTARGHATKADGVFGPGTVAKVKAFQKAQRLTADGVVGPSTWSRLVTTVKTGSKGTAVKALQHQLTANGHTIIADGVYGSATTTKVKAFQKAQRLTADGVVGPSTWAALIRGGGSGGGGGNPGGGGKLSDAQASAKLKAAGISRVSSGNCTARNRKNCTSLQSIRVGTVNGLVSLKKKSGCKVVVTGGTETSHAGGTYSHWNGYKVDISRTSCVTNYIQSHAKKHHKRRDGAWVWRVTSSGKTVFDYADERWANHWDITYY